MFLPVPLGVWINDSDRTMHVFCNLTLKYVGVTGGGQFITTEVGV
jgi:hypothetical protein